MASLTDLNTVARRLILELREGVERLERIDGTTSPLAPSLSRELLHKHSELQRISTQMGQQFRVLVIKENATKRELWKRKVEQVADEAAALRHALDKVAGRDNKRRVEEQQRSELFHRTTEGDMARQLAEEYDAEAQVFASAHRSDRLLDELLESGASVLSAMHVQKDQLKAAQRKVLDVLNRTGLSDSLLRMIDRRQRADAVLVYGGMAAVLLITGLCWWFFRRGAG